MKIIAKERGMGKTEYLIKRSLETKYPILVASDNMKRYIIDKCKYVTVLSVRDITSFKEFDFNTVLIDEVDLVLQKLLNLKPYEVTFTGDISIEQVENIPVVIKQDIIMKR